MKLPGAFVLAHLVVCTLKRLRSNKIHRQMNLSDDKQFQQMQQARKMADMSRRHTDENEMVTVKFGMDAESMAKQLEGADADAMQEHAQKQVAYYAKMTELNAKHDTEKQVLLSENKAKESLIDMDMTQNETQIKAVDADLEGMEAVLKKRLEGEGMD